MLKNVDGLLKMKTDDNELYDSVVDIITRNNNKELKQLKSQFNSVKHHLNQCDKTTGKFKEHHVKRDVSDYFKNEEDVPSKDVDSLSKENNDDEEDKKSAEMSSESPSSEMPSESPSSEMPNETPSSEMPDESETTNESEMPSESPDETES